MFRKSLVCCSTLLRRNFGAQAQMTDFEYALLRFRHCWHMWDKNGDGELTRKEYIEIGRTISEKCNIKFEGRNEEGTHAIWDAWTMGRPECAEAVTWNSLGPAVVQILKNPDSAKMMEPVNTMLFKWMDVDDTGTVSIREYRNFIQTVQGTRMTEEEIWCCFGLFAPITHEKDDWVITQEQYLKLFNSNAYSTRRNNPYSFAAFGFHPLDPEKWLLHPWTGEPLPEQDFTY